MKELRQAIKKWLLSKFHVCEYEVIEDRITNIRNTQGDIIDVTKTYIQRCSTCGNIKTKKIIY